MTKFGLAALMIDMGELEAAGPAMAAMVEAFSNSEQFGPLLPKYARAYNGLLLQAQGKTTEAEAEVSSCDGTRLTPNIDQSFNLSLEPSLEPNLQTKSTFPSDLTPHSPTSPPVTQYAAASALEGDNDETAKMFDQMSTAQQRVWGEEDERIVRLKAAATRLRQP